MHSLKPEEKRISRYICLQTIYAYELSSSENKKNYDSIFTKHFHADLENSYGQLSKAQLDYSKMLYIESIKNREEGTMILVGYKEKSKEEIKRKIKTLHNNFQYLKDYFKK